MGSLIKKAFCSLSLVSLFFFMPTLEADTMYTYTGKAITQTIGTAFPAGSIIQGDFITATPLGNNLNFQPVSYKSFSFFVNGVVSIDNTQTVPLNFTVSTDSSGKISAWNISLDINGGSNVKSISTASGSTATGSDFARLVVNSSSSIASNSGMPGTWTVSEVAVPEPGTYATLAGALTLVALVASKRRKALV